MPVITPSTTTRVQAVTDIIQSVALEETALSHILNAEGEKIQKMVAMADVTPEQLLATNKSVESMVNAVARLEMILQSKLSAFCSRELRQGEARGRASHRLQGQDHLRAHRMGCTQDKPKFSVKEELKWHLILARPMNITYSFSAI